MAREKSDRTSKQATTLDTLSAELAGLRSDVKDLRVEVGQVRADHGAEIQQVRADHGAEIQQVRADHAKDVVDLRGEIQQVRTDLGAEIQQFRAEHAADIADVRGEIQQFRAEHAADIAELRGEIRQVKVDLEHRMSTEIAHALGVIEERFAQLFGLLDDKFGGAVTELRSDLDAHRFDRAIHVPRE